MDFRGLAQFGADVFIIQTPKLVDDSYLVQSCQLHHGSSQSASPRSCLSSNSIFILSSHLHRSILRLVLPMVPEWQEKPGSASKLSASGCKLRKISSRSQHVNIWHILESNPPVGGYFSWCNLKRWCWDGTIKGAASSLIGFFKLQRESQVWKAYGAAWVTDPVFFYSSGGGS